MSSGDPAAVGAELERLVRELEAVPDAATRAKARELVRLLMELYGAGLGRMLDMARTETAGPQALVNRWAADGLVSSLLALHGLHPHPVEWRIERALEAIAPHIPQVTRVTLLEVDGESARVGVEGGAGLSRTQADGVQAAVARAVQEAAPEIAAVRMEGLEGAGLLQISRGPAEAKRTATP